MIELLRLRGPLAVTIAYFVLWYVFLFGLQSRTKYRLKARYEQEGKVFDRYFGQDPEMLAVDRVVANMQEQMGPFLVALWLFAVFSTPTYATWLGAAYVLLRSAYPVLLGKRIDKLQSRRVALVTVPSYLIVWTMLSGAAWAAFTTG
jgi:hypothetical protein